MRKPKKSTRRFVIDTNVFVAAIKPFTKNPARKMSTTNALTLLLKIVTNDDFELIANARLVSEYRKLAELNSPTNTLILKQLISKMEIIQVAEEMIELQTPPAKEGSSRHCACGNMFTSRSNTHYKRW